MLNIKLQPKNGGVSLNNIEVINADTGTTLRAVTKVVLDPKRGSYIHQLAHDVHANGENVTLKLGATGKPIVNKIPVQVSV